MRLRFVALAALALAAAVGATLTVREQALAWRQAGGPATLPARWQDPHGFPAAWVFSRPGCPHCRDHVAAMCEAIATYPDSVQSRLWPRIVFVGPDGAPRGVRVAPALLRGQFHVRIAPTTWWVGPEGRIRRAWRGARAADAWRRELDSLAVPAVRVAMP